MQPQGKSEELFAAFSRITRRVFSGDTLLSCPNLAKSPNYGQVLQRFARQAPHLRLTRRMALKITWRYLLSNGAHLLFLLLTRFYALLLGWKLPESLSVASLRHGQRPVTVIDTFAVLPKIVEEKCYKEVYLAGLYEAAQEAGYDAPRLFRLYGSRNPLVLWRAMNILHSTGNGLIEAHLLTLGDWLRLFRHVVMYPFALASLIRSLTHYPAASAERHIRDALLLTAGQCILHGEARRLAGLRLAMFLSAWAGPKESTPKIITWYENQAVNKAFHRGIRQGNRKSGAGIRIVGAQLFTWPPTLLNDHPDDAEAALGLAPDVVAVNGTYFLPQASTQPYVVGPSLRYADLFAPQAAKAPTGSVSSETADNILVLFSYHPEEIQRVLEIVLPLARSGRTIAYKFHPATQAKDYAAWLPDNPIIVTGSLSAAMNNAGFIIGSGSGVLAEAVCLGVPVITVEDTSGVAELGMNFLPPFGKGQLWQSIRKSSELAPALEELQAFLQTPGYLEKRLAFRALLYTEPTPARILELLAL